MPRSKKDTVRIIDTKPEVIGGGTLQTQALTIAPPPIGEVAAPSNLVAVASGVARSPVKPEAYVNVTWRAPLGGVVPSYYDIEYGRSSEWNNTTKTFTNPQRVQSYNLGVTLSLGLDTAYRIRVRSVYRNATSAWTDTVEVITADDTTPASPVTNVATNWNPITGDLTITWTNPTDPQFRDARVRIYKDATKAELYRTALSINGQYVYTYAQNLEDSSVGDPNLYLVIDTRNWSNSGTVYSTTVELATALAAPTDTPNATTDPDGITGSILWRWPAVSGATSYILNIDGKTRRVFTLEYEYPLSQNLIEHGGVIEEALKLIDNNSNILTDGTNQLTTNSNSSLGWSLVAVDIFNQQSPVQSGVVTFTAPGNVSISSVTTNGATGEAIWKWTAVPDCIGYRLTINNTTRNVFGTEFTYPLAQNIQENTTANPSLVYSLVAYNAVNLISQTSASGTATFARPSNITGATVTLNPVTGEAVWRWNAIASGITNYRITITSASTVVRNVFTNEYKYSLAQNIIDNGGSTPLTAIPYSIVAVDALNQVSVTAVTGTATFTAPATPSGLTASFNTPDCSFNWTAGSDVTGYRLTIDGTTRDLGFVNSYTYTLAQNASEHSNNPDPELAYILTAYNAVNQSSSTASATITSPLPNAPTAVTLTAFFNVLVADITAHVRLPTHRRYKFVFRRNTSTIVNTFYSPENTASLEIDQDGIYDVVVSAEDVFGRSSGTLTSTAVTPDVLTLEELRADAIYSDSVSTSPATLNVLKDNNTITGGVNYLSGATWRWTQFERPLLDRYRTCTAGLFNPTTNTQIYFSTSIDGSTWQWWAGLNVEEELLSVADETTARTNAITIGTTYALKTRWDLSSIVEARFIRIHHRNTVANYTIREFYPRRLVQSDDIEAESILAINIAAGTITGNNISSSARIVAGTGNNVGVLDGANTSASPGPWRIYAGNNDPTLAPFRVSQTGQLVATGADISGVINVTGGNAATTMYADGVASTAQTNAQNFATNAANTAEANAEAHAETYNNVRTVLGFTGTIAPTSANSVSWSGPVTLYLSNNTTVTITNGSATGITGIRYISWVPGTVVFTVGSTPTTTVGAVLIAIVQNGAIMANVQVLVGRTYISGDWINTGTITATNIAASTITGDKISSATTITAGTSPNVGVLDGTGTWRIYAGSTDPTLAPFKVSQTGALTATGANITGSITVTGGNASTIGQRITGLTGFIVPGVILTDGTNALLDNDSRYITDTSITTTVSWYNLVLFTADGNSYTITDGSASVTQRTYLTWTAGGTTLTAVTTPPTASSSVLVATVEPGAVALNIQAPAGTTYISGEWINTGSITARNISANTITANEIATDTITADKIAAGAITATKINVQDLSAISANLGTITAGTISGININGTTITGSTIRTSTNSTRVQIDTIGMEVFSLGNKVFELSTDTFGSVRFFGSDPTQPQYIIWWDSESMSEPLGSITGYKTLSNVASFDLVGYRNLTIQAGTQWNNSALILETSTAFNDGVVAIHPNVGVSNRRVGIGTGSPSHLLDVNGVIRGSSYRVGNNQVVGARIGTWGTPGGTLTRGTIAPDVVATPTAAEFNALAQNVRALIADLRSHGLIGN